MESLLMNLKILCSTLLTVSCVAAIAFSTDTDKFFNHDTTVPPKFAADKIYPQGRLFPFSFYSTGGGAIAKRGELLPDAEREADQKQIIEGGVTMIGPQYELNEMSLETAKKYGVKMIYTIVPTIDGEKVERAWLHKLNKERKALDVEKVRAAIAEEVKKVAHRTEIAWWDITPEELRFWVANEITYLKTAYEAIKANDPLNRPAYMYEPGHRNAPGLAKLLPWQDLSAKGMYLNYSSKKENRVWARYSVEQEVKAIEMADRPQVVPLALPEMFQQPKPEELKLVRDWVRHDVYCALVNGARGVVIFSASKRPKFEARQDYLNAYLEVSRELNGAMQLGQVFLFGKPMKDLDCTIIEGPQEIPLKLRTEEVKYSPISFANFAWNNQRYVFLVNSANVPVRAIVSELVYGSGITVKNLFHKDHEFTAPEGDFEVKLKPLEVAAFKIYLNQ